jgi:hypothetical protein
MENRLTHHSISLGIFTPDIHLDRYDLSAPTNKIFETSDIFILIENKIEDKRRTELYS